MDLLRIATAGSVDDGKSTLIGRLLYDSKAIHEDQLRAIERASRQRGDPDVDLALLTDGLRAEREQGITIDVAYRYFATPKRKFIIADTPGHTQYTRNMVTGASTAELAIVLIDARKGVLTQSRRHGFLSSLLADPAHPGRCQQDGSGRLQRTRSTTRSWRTTRPLPPSCRFSICLHSDFGTARRQRRAHERAHALVHRAEPAPSLGNRQRRRQPQLVDFRFPVQLAVRPHQDFRGFAGQVASGTIAAGEEVAVLPSGKTSRVRSIVAGGEPVENSHRGRLGHSDPGR